MSRLHVAVCASLLLLPAGAWAARIVVVEEPRWLTLRPPEAHVGMEVDGFTEEVSNNAGSSSYDRLLLTPLVGLSERGSIYHPNLLTFMLEGEAGWGWDSITTKSSSSSASRNESMDFQRYLAQINLLASKPYNATFVAARDHTYRDYGTFDTYEVDSSRYGGHVGWMTENFSLNADMGVRAEEATGLVNSTKISETYFNFTGLHHRRYGQTSVFCRYNEFDNTIGSGSSQNSSTYSIGASDSETFGSRRHIVATTGMSYSRSEYSGQESDTVTANETVTVNHRPKLDSFLTVDFSRSRYGSMSATRLQGVYGVRHQLYESLTSQLDAHGSYDDSTGLGTTASNDRYGVGINENYTKRLGSWGRLNVNLGAIIDHQDFDSSGSVLWIHDESHNLTNPPVFLASPRVVAGSVQVRSAVGGFIYTYGVDYTTNVVGELTQIIPVLPLSTDVALHGTDVLVDYQSESLFNASYDSFGASAQIRLDLYRQFGLYARVNWMDNTAPPNVLTQSLTDFIAGADYNWRWLHAGAEYEDYDSNFVQYQAWRFYQSVLFQPTPDQNFSLNFMQTFYTYADKSEQNQYQFLGRYYLQLLASLSWFIEGGYTIQEVLDTEQLYGSMRTGITWTRGKLSLRSGYEYNTQTTTTGGWSEERIRHRFYAYLRRTF